MALPGMAVVQAAASEVNVASITTRVRHPGVTNATKTFATVIVHWLSFFEMEPVPS